MHAAQTQWTVYHSGHGVKRGVAVGQILEVEAADAFAISGREIQPQLRAITVVAAVAIPATLIEAVVVIGPEVGLLDAEIPVINPEGRPNLAIGAQQQPVAVQDRTPERTSPRARRWPQTERPHSSPCRRKTQN